MAARIPLKNVDEAIQAIEADGGVILTGFSSKADVRTVNADAKPEIDAIVQEVRTYDLGHVFDILELK